MIASVHIRVNLPKLNRIKRYHSIAKAIRTCLHAYGIHSSTIQPEFADSPPEDVAVIDDDEEEEDAPLLHDTQTAKGCLFECIGGGECMDNRCCEDAAATDSKKDDGNGNGNGNGIENGGIGHAGPS